MTLTEAPLYHAASNFAAGCFRFGPAADAPSLTHSNSMKLTSFLLVAFILAAVSNFSSAQQMVSPPSGQTDETPDATPEPSPSARETPVARPRTHEAPVTPLPPRPEAAAAVSKKEPKPETAEARPLSKKEVEAALKEMENRWEAAIAAHDAGTVAGLVASDFSGINSKGKFVDRKDMIAEVKNDRDTYKSMKNEKLNVHLYGPTVAVVTGSARSQGSSKDGQAFDRTYRYTDTWVQRNGQWQCVASQDSLLSGK